MLIWTPRYTLSPAIVRALMDIEAAKAVIEQLPLPPAAEAELCRRARLRSTHYSTRIEGNRLTLAETEQVTHLAADHVLEGCYLQSFDGCYSEDSYYSEYCYYYSEY